MLHEHSYVKNERKKEIKVWMETYREAISCLGVVGFVFGFLAPLYCFNTFNIFKNVFQISHMKNVFQISHPKEKKNNYVI